MTPARTDLDTKDEDHDRMTVNLSTTRPDRKTYAIATMATGLAIGGFVVLTRDLDSTWLWLLAYAIFMALILGAQEWVDRTTNTAPRHSKRRAAIGMGASMLITLGLVMPWLNWSARTDPLPIAMQLIAVAVVALPCWIAALVIYRDAQ